MILRNLSQSRLKRFISPLFLSTEAYTKTRARAVCDCLPTAILDPLSALYFTQNHCRFLPFLGFNLPFSSRPGKSESFSSSPPIRDGNYDEASSEMLPSCPGCGILMQDSDTNQPGFFAKPSFKSPDYKKFAKMTPVVDESEISDSLKKGVLNEVLDVGNMAAQEISFSENSGVADNLGRKKIAKKPTVCSRCHSLRYYGKVKEPSVENLLPDFDFDHTVGRRLMSVSGARTVVLLLVDVTDFDGSFPWKVASLISRTINENDQSWKEGRSGNVPRLVLVVTKIDLLPSSISPTRLEHWVRTRLKKGGAVKLSSVHLVSAPKDWGVKNLLDDVVTFAGPRGNVWVVGMQNAGKSTLINAFGKSSGLQATHLTEASVPGTTLGIVRVEGLLPGKAKLFDTPGLLNPCQMSSRLSSEEQKLVHIDKELKPRTYRIKAGHSIHIAGLMRLDIEESSVESVYITVWASPLLPLHMGKTENACTLLETHFGHQLQPPIGEEQIQKLGKWVRKEVSVSGVWWDSSSTDIAAAGLGWFAVGLKGETLLGVWTYEGIDVVVRDALLPQRSINFEVAGFTVSDIVSKADKTLSKKSKKENKKKHSRPASSSSPLVVNKVYSSTLSPP